MCVPRYLLLDLECIVPLLNTTANYAIHVRATTTRLTTLINQEIVASIGLAKDDEVLHEFLSSDRIQDDEGRRNLSEAYLDELPRKNGVLHISCTYSLAPCACSCATSIPNEAW